MGIRQTLPRVGGSHWAEAGDAFSGVAYCWRYPRPKLACLYKTCHYSLPSSTGGSPVRLSNWLPLGYVCKVTCGLGQHTKNSIPGIHPELGRGLLWRLAGQRISWEALTMAEGPSICTFCRIVDQCSWFPRGFTICFESWGVSLHVGMSMSLRVGMSNASQRHDRDAYHSARQIARHYWQLDAEADMCSITNCNNEFSKRWTGERRHHCRQCGRVVCGACSRGQV